MTQQVRQAQVTDGYDRPVPGAEIYVTDTLTLGDTHLTSDGVTPLAQPVTTDEFGIYTYYANAGFYREDIYFGGKLRYREIVAVGIPPQLKGDPGGDVMAVNLFTGLNTSTVIPVGANLIHTSGHSDVGMGAADYAEFTAVGGEVANAWRVQVNTGRWFRLAEPDLQLDHFGYVGTSNDDPAWDAALDYLDRGRPLGRGGRIRVGAYETTIGTTKTISTMPVVVEGEVGTIQPSLGSRIKLAAGVTGFDVQNGPSGQGANSAFRNLRFTGQGSAVSLVNADNGVGCAILAQANSMAIESCVIVAMPGHGVVAKTGYPTDIAGANANNCRMIGTRIAGSLRSGGVFRGINSNLWELQKCDLDGNTEYGLDLGSFLGDSGRVIHFSANGIAAMIVRNTSSYNGFEFLYKEPDGKPSLIIEADSGPAIAEYNDIRWSLNPDGYTNLSSGAHNYIGTNGHLSQALIGGTPGDPDIILQDQLVRLVRGLILRMADNPLTTFWDTQVLAGSLHIGSGSGNPLTIDAPLTVNGLIATGAHLEIAGNQVVGPRASAIADAVGAAGATPTQAEFNALVGKFNDWRAQWRAHGLGA